MKFQQHGIFPESLTKILQVGLILVLFMACKTKEKADLILINGNIYTVDSAFSVVQAMAIHEGKIVGLGSNEEVISKFEGIRVKNLRGKPVYPGFYDSHGHFIGYAKTLGSADLAGTKSFEEVVERLLPFRNQPWITGRGWDQNDWEKKEFPDNFLIDSLFPGKPVFLKRIDGHAALASSEALRMGNVKPGMKIDGGLVETKNGKLTGMLVDNAMDMVGNLVPELSGQELAPWIMEAERNCFRSGLTTVTDPGLRFDEVFLADSLQKKGKLKIRIYAMLTPGEKNKQFFYGKPKAFYKTDRLHVRSVKLYADGALGSRGARLLEPYKDAHGSHGLFLTHPDTMKKLAALCLKNGFQVNTHCIGDSANRTLLEIYAGLLGNEKELRWRIEHAQVVHENDRNFFRQFGIIPSVQPTHATSDMYWVEKRLGTERIHRSYAYKSLLNAAGIMAIGSDFPVESINPLFGFYAAVSRKDQYQFPENGFLKEEALTREQALKGMTIWAAYANFEEKEKGSLEIGKFADFVVLNKDLMKAPEHSLFNIQVLQTFLGGELVFKKKR